MLSMFGYGNVAKAITSTYKKGEWYIYDDKFSVCSEDEFGNRLLPTSYFNPDKSSIEVVSPGIAPNHILCKSAKNLTSEIDFYNEALGLSIWVSGTNGKTTTTEMISYLLNIEAGANIGKPIALMNLKAPLVVLEMSSFALHYTKVARPELYVLLPICDDHISWHGSFNNYEKAKLDLIFRMNKTASIIVPKKYEEYLKSANCIKYFYENSSDLAKLFDIDLARLNYNEPFLLDACLALAACKIISGKIEYEKISKFKIGRHRVEIFKDSKNRIWIDDSKATNISAALAAINSFKEPLHLIAGGDAKGQDLNEFFSKLDKNIKLYLIGKSDFSDIAKKHGLNPIRTNLKEAVSMIYKDLTTKEIALLSPACASLDEFSSYAERGDLFIKYMKDLDV
ncbi:UDP-N-acetylmuramoyl-L-alanine--D-glutamate ligase [Campylobacter sp. RM12642]|uniref:UDP-N-acetylmuramoyl-L-alanine--D-glutamate ligase n=1 Tax=Campylobacter sp. RM12642 TaxID=2735736 RepID=UPI0030146A98|nr:UDP-N-acetylmuramoyl-L-alanine--D-glutamate ligase [Campylobacter sp. RM12642]